MEGFIGEIMLFAGNFAPRSWAFCNGALINVAQNTALFSILGTTFGGDGRTTFALPDLQGRVPIHEGRGPGLSNRRLGERGGIENVVLNTSQIPSHDHFLTGGGATVTLSGTVALGVSTSVQNSSDPTTGAFADATMYSSAGPEGIYSHVNSSLALGGTTGIAGSTQSHNNMMPSLGMYYIICTMGVYPSRS